MPSQRKRDSAEFKARVALEAIKGHMTIHELASQCGVHPHWVTQWQKHALACLPQRFANRVCIAEVTERDPMPKQVIDDPREFVGSRHDGRFGTETGLRAPVEGS